MPVTDSVIPSSYRPVLEFQLEAVAEAIRICSLEDTDNELERAQKIAYFLLDLRPIRLPYSVYQRCKVAGIPMDIWQLFVDTSSICRIYSDRKQEFDYVLREAFMDLAIRLRSVEQSYLSDACDFKPSLEAPSNSLVPLCDSLIEARFPSILKHVKAISSFSEIDGPEIFYKFCYHLVRLGEASKNLRDNVTNMKLDKVADSRIIRHLAKCRDIIRLQPAIFAPGNEHGLRKLYVVLKSLFSRLAVDNWSDFSNCIIKLEAENDPVVTDFIEVVMDVKNFSSRLSEYEKATSLFAVVFSALDHTFEAQTEEFLFSVALLANAVYFLNDPDHLKLFNSKLKPYLRPMYDELRVFNIHMLMHWDMNLSRQVFVNFKGKVLSLRDVLTTCQSLLN